MPSKRFLAIALLAAFVLVSIALWFPRSRTLPDRGMPVGADHSSELQPLDDELRATARSTVKPNQGPEVAPTQHSIQPQELATVSIVNEAYQPEVGASIRIQVDGKLVVEGASGAQGEFTVRWPAAELLELQVHKEGAGSELLELQRPFPTTITVVLSIDGLIEGTVRTSDGRAVGAGTRVVALPGEVRFPPARLLEHICLEEAWAPCVKTDEHGRFLISKLRKGAKYFLLAGSKEWATPGLSGQVVAGDEKQHDLTVQGTFRCAIELYDSKTNQPVVVPASYAFGLAIHFRLKNSGLSILGMSPSELSCITDCSPAPTGSSHRIEATFVASDSNTAPGPIEVRINLPGFEPWAGPVIAAASSGTIASQKIALRPVADGFGTLIVRLPQALRPQFTRPPQPLLGLMLRNPRHGVLKYDLNPTASNEIVLNGIPYGEAECVLIENQLGATIPSKGAASAAVKIGAEPVLIEFDQPHLATIVIDPRRPDGSQYAGSLEVMLLEGRAPESGVRGFKSVGTGRTFAGPPFRLELLTPGEYTVVPLFPKGVEEYAAVIATSDVETPCIIQVP